MNARKKPKVLQDVETTPGVNIDRVHATRSKPKAKPKAVAAPMSAPVPKPKPVPVPVPAQLPLDDAHAVVLTVIARIGMVDRSTIAKSVTEAASRIDSLEAAGCITACKIDRRDGSRTTVYRMQPRGTAALHEYLEAGPAIPTKSGSRNLHSAAIYDGAELNRLSNRPGAYDAMALRSIINGRERTLQHPSLPQPATVARPEFVNTRDDTQPVYQSTEVLRRLRIPGSTYAPYIDGIPARVITALQAPDAPLAFTYDELTRRFGAVRTSISATFAQSRHHGVLVRTQLNGHSALGLPMPPASSRPLAHINAA